MHDNVLVLNDKVLILYDDMVRYWYCANIEDPSSFRLRGRFRKTGGKSGFGIGVSYTLLADNNSFCDVVAVVVVEGLSVCRVYRGRYFGIDEILAGMRQLWGIRPWSKDHIDVSIASPFVFRDR